jgi:hypothetical protein
VSVAVSYSADKANRLVYELIDEYQALGFTIESIYCLHIKQTKLRGF